LAEGADNYLADAETYVYESDDDEPNATLFSKGDLTITGEGRLTVTARYLDGIASKDGLKITGGVITVGAKDDGIRGRDYVAISGGEISVRADGDGIKATNDEDPDRGFVLIEGGRIDVIAGADGIQAETTLAVQGGDITLSTGGGSANASPQASQAAGPGRWPAGQAAASEDSGDSAKGLKAGVSLSIAAGTITIDSADDAVHSNDSVAISGGSLTLASGDDGIHADASLTISGGLVRITTSYEGIESAMITISGGEMHVTARDDGLNVAGGVDGSAVNGRPGQNVFADTADRRLEISGGTIVVDANGDGIDVNGAIIMTGGVVLISGPTASMNGALDYDRGFQITGGLLVAAGSAGMAQAPDRTSTQHAVLLGFSTVQQAGSIVHIADSAGGDILTFAPAKDYQTIAFSSPDLAQGASYTVYTGGQSSGEAVDGLYSDGVYTPGSEALTFTVSDIITAAGANLGGMRGGAPGGGGRPGR